MCYLVNFVLSLLDVHRSIRSAEMSNYVNAEINQRENTVHQSNETPETVYPEVLIVVDNTLHR